MQSLDITIAGEINLDLILYGLPREIPAEREVLATGFQATLGSSSAILAHNLAALGVATGLLTRVGRDELGEMALNRLAESGVDLSRVVRATGPTSTGVTVLLHHGDVRRIVTYPGTMFEMSRADLDIEYLASARHFHLSSLFLHRALLADLPEVFRELKSRGLTISLDTNDDPEDKWAGLFPSFCRWSMSCCRTRTSCAASPIVTIWTRRSGNWRQSFLSLRSSVDKTGPIVQDHGKRTKVAAVPVHPIDTIGAGDSFNAGFLAAWLHGCNAEESAAAGNITGAFSTQRPGGTEAFRSPKESASFLRTHNFPAIRGGA